jgi:hypothetical protein
VTIARASSDEAFARDVLAAASNVILALGDQHT